MVAYWKSLNEIPEQFRKDILEVHYKRLCCSKEEVMNEVLSFANLKESREHQTILANYKLEAKNDKWKQSLTVRQKQELNQALAELKLESFLHD